MGKVRSLWHLSDSQSVIKENTAQNPSPSFLKIQSHFSLISTGTERLVACGEVPGSVHDDMKVPYMEGAFPFPIKYGYSLVGKVITEGHSMTGKLVHAMHPHQDFCLINESDLFEIHSNIPAQRATLASNLETALTAVWDAQVNIGDRVLIVGFGLIGSLIARLLSFIPAIYFQIIEIDKERIQHAEKLGFPVSAILRKHSKFDIAFHTSATAEGLQTCIDGVGLEGKIIELSWYGKKPVKINMGGSFHSQRKQIISSQVGKLPSKYNARWDMKRRKKVVFELLENALFDQQITHFIKFVDTPTFFADLRAGKAKGLAYCIEY